jgi:GntR family transcriptional regulator
MDATVEPFKARRIYLLLRDRINSGALAAGERLPAEPELASTYGVSRVTVRRALELLAADEMVERRPGVGTFVRAAVALGSTILDFSDVFSHLKEMGRLTRVRLLSFDYLLPAAPVAAALGLVQGERAQRAVRVRMIGDAPFSHLTTHVPERVGQTYSEAELASQPLLALLERSGVVVGRARQSIGATLAGPEVAGLLQLDIGAPLLSLTRLVEDEAGRAVEHLHALYRPDRFTFEMQLQRTGAQGERRWSPLPPPGTGDASTGQTAEPKPSPRSKRIPS